MNNLKKVGLTALAGALVSVSANAADVAVSVVLQSALLVKRSKLLVTVGQ